jgi:catechol 2,3-dioxygenase-like lactoylglutathione lyase family enzyme
MALTVEALDHLVINVRDVEAAAAWYQRVLGMTREDFDPGPGKVRRTSVKFGRQKINLRPLSASKEEWFTADNERAGSDDLCFLTSASPQAVADHLRACGVAVIEGPSDKRGAQGTIVSVYCRDPDGSLIEISSYK